MNRLKKFNLFIYLKKVNLKNFNLLLFCVISKLRKLIKQVMFKQSALQKAVGKSSDDETRQLAGAYVSGDGV